MLDFISPLCSWAISQPSKDIPTDILRSAHHQHVLLRHLLKVRNAVEATAIEQAHALNKLGAPVTQPWGSVVVSAYLYAWRFPNQSWNNYLASIAIAEESATRVGLYLWLQPEAQRALWMRLVAVMVLHARIHHFDAQQLKQLLALGTSLIQSASESGIQAAPYMLDTLAWSLCEQALAHQALGTQVNVGVSWTNGLLLHHSFLGLGQHYFSRLRIFNESVGSIQYRTAFEAVHEILKRHVKAADKPLRPDQLLRVDIELPYKAAASPALSRETLSTHLPYSVAMVLIAREIDASLVTKEWLATHEHELRDIAQRINCVYSEHRKVQCWLDRIQAFGPLFSNVEGDQLCHALGIEQWRHRLSIKRAVGKQSYQSFGTSFSQLDSWRPQDPTRVALYTTRGGKWPEERSVVLGLAGALSSDVQNLRDGLVDIDPNQRLSECLF